MDWKHPIIRTDKQIDFHWTLYSPVPELTADFYAVRWTGNLTPPHQVHTRSGLKAMMVIIYI